MTYIAFTSDKAEALVRGPDRAHMSLLINALSASVLPSPKALLPVINPAHYMMGTVAGASDYSPRSPNRSGSRSARTASAGLPFSFSTASRWTSFRPSSTPCWRSATT